MSSQYPWPAGVVNWALERIDSSAMSLAARLHGALFFSGAAALVYQIVWVRQLSLVLGSTYEAIATVLGVFMAGLGLGSLLAAQWADRWNGVGLTRLFAGLEGGTAVVALAFPLIMYGLSPAFASLASSAALVGLARLATAALALLVPTTLMGATLPVLAAHWEGLAGGRSVGATAGALYAANTAGAVTGCLLAGVFLIEHFGLRATTFLAVALNLGAAILVLTTARSDVASPIASEVSRQPPRLSRRVLPVAFLSGLGALASEVAWTRALVLVIGPTTYGFSFVVAAVILGLALGSAFGARFPRGSGLFFVQLGAAASCLVVIAVVPSLVMPVGELVRRYAEDASALLSFELLGVVALLLVPGFCFGATFPMVVERLGGAAARATGSTLWWNTAGAVTGSFFAGFFVLPMVSTRAVLILAVLAHVAAAFVVIPRERPLSALAPSVLVLAALLVPSWDAEILSGGLYKYAPYLEPGEFLDFLRRGELVFYEEDRAATVSVKKVGSRVSLAVDGKVDATNTEDLVTQRLLAHVPLALHRDPKEVLVIGLGSGVTAGSALTHRIERLDAVEISPGVIEAQRLFSEVNHRAGADPRLHLVVGDGRNHLLLLDPDRRYDVIISEPSNPWMAGVSGLFTRELFELASRRLGPAGLFCQWAHLYNLREEDLRTLVGTFTDVFGETALFALSESDILLVGTPGGFELASPETVAARLSQEEVAIDLASVGVLGAAGLAMLYTAATPALADWAEGADRHTDDHPVLEFRAPRAMHLDTSRRNLEALVTLRSESDGRFQSLQVPATARDLRARAQALLLSESFAWAFDTFELALELEPRSLEAHLGLLRAGVLAGRVEETQERLDTLARDRAPVEARIAIATLYRDQGMLDEAIRFLADALRLEPARRDALLLAAEVAGERGELDAMANLARTQLAEDPLDAEAAALLAESTLRRGDFALAARQARGITERRSENARAQKVLAIALAESGDEDGARGAFEALIALEPDAYVHRNNFAAFERRSGHLEKAAGLYEEAVDLSPLNVEGYQGLKETAEAVGDEERLKRAQAMLALHGVASP